MMREVVDDGDAVHLRFDFETALHALECLQRGGDCIFWNSAGESESGRRGGVPNVVFAGKGELEVGPLFAIVKDGPGGTVGNEAEVGHFPIRSSARAVAIDRAEGLR